MIGIIGAGISGLTLAYELEKTGREYILLECSERVGGVIKTERMNNMYLLEAGASSILADEELLHFFEDLDIVQEIVYASEKGKIRYILKDDELQSLPDSPAKLVTSSFFSLSAKMKILSEPLKKASLKENETVEAFFLERFGREVAEYVVKPFIAAIYAGDPANLLVSETFPLIKEYLDRNGSILSTLKQESAERLKTLSFKAGLSTLPEAIATRLKSLKLNTQIEEIKKKTDSFSIKLKGERKHLQVSDLILCTPAYVSSRLISNLYPDFSDALARIDYPPLVVSHSVYDKVSVRNQLNGFGALYPKKEQKFSAATIWTSTLFPNRCSPDEIMLTNFTGGSQFEQNALKDEPFIRNKLHSEMGKIYGIKGGYKFYKQFKWDKSLPQFNINILPALQFATDLEKERVFVCASWKNGVSIGECIKKARILASRFI